MTRLLIALIHAYQRWVSPLLGKNCRYLPTCSEYAVDALRIHGFFLGSLLAAWRILRCSPFGGHGYDPVPPKGAWSRAFRRAPRGGKP